MSDSSMSSRRAPSDSPPVLPFDSSSRDSAGEPELKPGIAFTKDDVQQSIPNRFEEVVALCRSQIAISWRDRLYTYESLDHFANRVAGAVLDSCGESNEPIALLFEPGIAGIAAVFGILKAGKFVLPIDPCFPEERIRYFLANSGARLLVADADRLDLAANFSNESISILDLTKLDNAVSSIDPNIAISPDEFAALLYTSGSTGQPKGVLQSHRTLLHATMRRTRSFNIRPEDRLMLVASGTYQAMMNILASLLNGARLCPFNIKEEGISRLVPRLSREGITIYHSSASLFREVAATLNGTEDLSKIRQVRLASETVTKSDVELYRKHFSDNCLFTNGLGSTETGMLLCYNISKDTPIPSESVPLGYPLDDVEILLLDDDGHEMECGRIGEITVRSRYLTPGYWRRPDLTAAKFRPDPTGSDKRIYLTGDLGRMSPAGYFEHRGRKDFMVKVRGYRVETGDIEAKLLEHPAVKEAAVIGRRNEAGENQLIAYFVPVSDSEPSVSELRRFLKGQLPDYMLPAVFVAVEILPRTPNGKLDRLALPVAGHSRPALEVPFAPPRTAVEAELARIWAEVLSMDKVGIHDNFLDLGGHSLNATRIISRVIQRFELELPVHSLLDAPTVAEMAVIIAQNQAKKASDEDLGRMLAELEALSDDAAQRLLSAKNT